MKSQIKENKIKARSSNLELLKILSIVMIIFHHYTVHSGFNFSSDMTLNRIIIQLLSMGGKLGVNCFVLISGYFLCTRTDSRWKSIVLYAVKLTFISLAIYLSFVCFGEVEFELRELKRRALPLLNNYWWFANTYFVLIILSPTINKVLNKATKKELLSAIGLFTLLWCVIPTASLAYMESNNLIWFIYLYTVAAYIRKYPSYFSESKKMPAIFSSLSFIAMVASILLLDHFGQKIPLYSDQAMHFVDMQGVLSTVFCVSIFCVFKNMKPFVSKTVNLISGSIFGVYLLHDHGYTRPYIWQELMKGSEYQESSMLLLHAIISVSIVFAVCTVASMILTLIIDKPIIYLLNKYESRIENRARRIKNGIKHAAKEIYNGMKPDGTL